MCVKLVFLVGALQPIHSPQKLLESGGSLIHRMSHIVTTNLQTEMTRFLEDFTLGDEVTSVLNMLPAVEAQAVRADFHVFGQCLS